MKNDGGALSRRSASHVDALVASASSAALALPPHGVQGRLAWFAPLCRVNCMWLCSPWVCQLSFRSNLPKAVHVPGVASLPGPPIPRLPAPSVFACVLLGIGVPWCLPHLREDAVWGGSMTAVCLHSAFCGFSCFFMLCFSLCRLLLFASSLLRWWCDWVVCILSRSFLRVLAVSVCLHLGVCLVLWLALW